MKIVATATALLISSFLVSSAMEEEIMNDHSTESQGFSDDHPDDSMDRSEHMGSDEHMDDTGERLEDQ